MVSPVVGVHDAMNEADKQPLRDKSCLARNHLIKKGAIGVRGARRLWVMPRDDVISEAPDRIQIPARREELEGADTDVARRDAGQHRAGQRRLAPHRVAGGDGRERSGGRDPKRRHGLADDVFAQNGAEGGTAVSAARKWGGAGAFELDVVA